MRKKVYGIALSAGLLISFALPSVAQNTVTTPSFTNDSTKNIASQQGTISGIITDKGGNPIVGALITVKGSQEKAVTDIDGHYLLSGIMGSHALLRVSCMGYQPGEFTVALGSKGNQDANFKLTERPEKLQTVEVIGRNERSYKNTMSFIGTKTETPLKDVPQSIGYVTKELVRDQGATTVNDVVKNISGVNQYTFYNDFSIRGFRTTGNRNSGNLVNGMRAQTSLWKQQSLANIERVEVIKGPASALFGNAAPGGVINRVTKKPLFNNRNVVSTTVGSFNTLNTYGDFTGPLDKKSTFLYRLNIGYEHTDSYRDLQANTNYIVAPSFSYLPTKNTRFNIDIVYQHTDGKVDRGQSIFGDKGLSSVPITRSLSAANDFLKENLVNITLGLTHRFSDKLSFNATYLNSSYDEDLREHNQANAYVKLADGSQSPSRILMQCLIRQRHFRNNSFNTYFNYNVQTGILKHRLLFGYDYFQMEQLAGSSSMIAGGYLLKDGKTTNTFKPANIAQYVLDADGNPKTNVPYYDLNSDNNNVERDFSKYTFVTSNLNPYLQYSHGIYLQEQLEVGVLKLLLGVRQEYFTDILNKKTTKESRTHQHAFIPRLGVVVSLNKNINLYGTWVKGFEPQSASVQGNPNTGGPFDPEYSQLFEVGAKSEWFDHKLSMTLSFFHLTKTNTLYNAGDTDNPELLKPVGEETSKGIELDIAGFILPNWSVVANYAYTHAAITKTMDNNEADFGMQRPNTPRNAFNVWSKYIIRKGMFRNLGVGVGVNAVTKRFGQVGKRANTIVYPGYGLLNAAFYYQMKRLQMQINLDNILDKTYWVGGYDKLRSFPGAPRSIKATVTYQF